MVQVNAEKIDEVIKIFEDSGFLLQNCRKVIERPIFEPIAKQVLKEARPYVREWDDKYFSLNNLQNVPFPGFSTYGTKAQKKLLISKKLNANLHFLLKNRELVHDLCKNTVVPLRIGSLIIVWTVTAAICDRNRDGGRRTGDGSSVVWGKLNTHISNRIRSRIGRIGRHRKIIRQRSRSCISI